MAISAALKKKLAAANKKFKTAVPTASGGMVNENVEDGNYSADLTGADVVEQGGKAALVFTFDVDVDGETEQVKNRYWLETEQNLGYLKRDLARFGFEGLEDLDLAEDLEGVCEKLVSMKPVCRITVKTNDQWQNVYLNKVVEIGDGAEDDDEVESETVEETTAEEEEDGTPVSIGSKVLYKDAEHEITALNEGEGTCTLKNAKGKRFVGVKLEDCEAVADDEVEPEAEEEVEEEEELAELGPGSEVMVQWKGKEEPGVVKAVSEDDEKVTVQLTKLKKLVIVSLNKVELKG
jgi:hypothetical protein